MTDETDDRDGAEGHTPPAPAPDGIDIEHHLDDDPGTDHVAGEYVTAHVVVRETPQPPAPGLRGRALALRAALPQLARNPVVVGTSAAVATIAVRVAVDVARRALGAPSAPARPTALTVTGSVLHQVHVVRHVHVVHHYPLHHPVPVSWWTPPPPPR